MLMTNIWYFNYVKYMDWLFPLLIECCKNLPRKLQSAF